MHPKKPLKLRRAHRLSAARLKQLEALQLELWGAKKIVDLLLKAKNVHALTRLLNQPDADVRSLAVKALGELGAVFALTTALKNEHANVRATAAVSLGSLRAVAAIPDLAKALKDNSADVRWLAIQALGNIGGSSVARVLARALRDPDASCRIKALEILHEKRAIVPELKQVAENDPDPAVRNMAKKVLMKPVNKKDLSLKRTRGIPKKGIEI